MDASAQTRTLVQEGLERGCPRQFPVAGGVAVAVLLAGIGIALWAGWPGGHM